MRFEPEKMYRLTEPGKNARFDPNLDSDRYRLIPQLPQALDWGTTKFSTIDNGVFNNKCNRAEYRNGVCTYSGAYA